MQMKIIFSEKCLEYSWPGHIEGPERVRRAFAFLRKEYEFLEPKSASSIENCSAMPWPANTPVSTTKKSDPTPRKYIWSRISAK